MLVCWPSASAAEQSLKIIGERVGGSEGYCSKIRTAGLGSLSETTTNFEAETVYMMPFPPKLPAVVPLPFAGRKDTEQLALAAGELRPLHHPTTRMPRTLP